MGKKRGSRGGVKKRAAIEASNAELEALKEQDQQQQEEWQPETLQEEMAAGEEEEAEPLQQQRDEGEEMEVEEQGIAAGAEPRVEGGQEGSVGMGTSASRTRRRTHAQVRESRSRRAAAAGLEPASAATASVAGGSEEEAAGETTAATITEAPSSLTLSSLDPPDSVDVLPLTPMSDGATSERVPIAADATTDTIAAGEAPPTTTAPAFDVAALRLAHDMEVGQLKLEMAKRDAEIRGLYQQLDLTRAEAESALEARELSHQKLVVELQAERAMASDSASRMSDMAAGSEADARWWEAEHDKAVSTAAAKVSQLEKGAGDLKEKLRKEQQKSRECGVARDKAMQRAREAVTAREGYVAKMRDLERLLGRRMHGHASDVGAPKSVGQIVDEVAEKIADLEARNWYLAEERGKLTGTLAAANQRLGGVKDAVQKEFDAVGQLVPTTVDGDAASKGSPVDTLDRLRVLSEGVKTLAGDKETLSRQLEEVRAEREREMVERRGVDVGTSTLGGDYVDVGTSTVGARYVDAGTCTSGGRYVDRGADAVGVNPVVDASTNTRVVGYSDVSVDTAGLVEQASVSTDTSGLPGGGVDAATDTQGVVGVKDKSTDTSGLPGDVRSVATDTHGLARQADASTQTRLFSPPPSKSTAYSWWGVLWRLLLLAFVIANVSLYLVQSAEVAAWQAANAETLETFAGVGWMDGGLQGGGGGWSDSWFGAGDTYPLC